MSRLSIILKKLRESRELNMVQLAEKANVGVGTIGDIERGKNGSTPKTLEKISKALNLTEKEREELMSTLLPEDLSKKMVKGNIKTLTDDDFIEIPVRAKASAGNGYINLEDCLYFTKIRKNGYHKECYIIEVVGNSMEPVIDDGALVIVDPLQTSYIKDKVYVVKYNEEVYIKKVEIDEKTNFMILKSVNPNYENVYIPSSESSSVKILGRAIKFYSEGSL